MSAPSPAWRAAGAFGWRPRSIRRQHRGHIHDSFVVTDPSGRFLLQRVNRAVFPDPVALSANLAAARRVLGAGVVPTPVADPDGACTVEVAGGTWRAFVLVEGSAAPPHPTPAALRSAGGLLGRFHAGLAALDAGAVVEVLPRFHDLGRRLCELRAAVERDEAHRAAAAGPDIDRALADAPLAAAVDGLAATLPRRVAHNDAKLDNLIFRRGRAVCLIDLDTLMPGHWFWDVGDLLRSASSTAAEDTTAPAEVSVDPRRYAAVLEGYRHAMTGVTLGAAELDALEVAGAAATYEQALRFLTDWLAGDRYYRTARPDHNRDRARSQLALLGAMPRPPWAP